MSNYPVDPDVFVQAYREIGYTPVQREWIDLHNKKCCGLTALALKNNPDLEEKEEMLEEEGTSHFTDSFFHENTESRLGFHMDRHQVYSFLEGFDMGLSSEKASLFPYGWTALGDEVWKRLRKEFKYDERPL